MKKILSTIAFSFVLFAVQAQKKESNSLNEWSKRSNIYEINVRQFSAEGSFSAVEKALPRLKKMGVEILWLMPVHPIGLKGRKYSENDLGSYYSVKDYKGINPEFGNGDDFKSLVNTAHKLKFKLIIDWVANHSAQDNHWVTSHPDFYVKDSVGNFVSPFDWTDVLKLNYKNKELRDSMTDAMLYWINNYNIDGFRCDVAEEVPNDFWKNCIGKLRERKDIFMLAEGNKPDLHKAGFDETYNWNAMGLMTDLYSGKIDLHTFEEGIYSNGKSFGRDASRLFFTSNHDENSWNGTEFEKYGAAYKLFAVFTQTMAQSVPLIYNGQERSNKKRLKFFVKDTIDWTGESLEDFYEALLKLRRDNDAMASGYSRIKTQNISDKNIMAYFRESDKNKVLVILNMSAQPKKISINDDMINGKAKNIFTGKKSTLKSGERIELEPWGYQVYEY